MGSVRPVHSGDLPALIELNRQAFPGSASLTREEQQRRFRTVCFEHPWLEEGAESLVFDKGDGAVGGFLAVTPRRMRVGQREVRVAVCQHLMVEKGVRSSLAALELLKEALAGPQDITMADMANDISKLLWERLGGRTSRIYSFHWRRALRPLAAGLALVGRRSRVRALARIGRPLGSAVDSLVVRLPGTPFRRGRTELTLRDLDVRDLAAALDGVARDYILAPLYDEGSLAWLCEVLEREDRFGSFQKVGAYDAKGRLAGWFLYFLSTRDPSLVLQVGATEGAAAAVLECLFEHAWQGGAFELTGRLDPRLMRETARKLCVVVPGRHWTVVHAAEADLLEPLFTGEAFLSRLEGDLWLL